MIKFVLMVNKQGQTRLAKYTNNKMTVDERRILEGEIVRKCLVRIDKQCNFIEHRGFKVVYRRYASLFFLVGVDEEENELSVLDFIHCLVETLDKWFGNVCELDIMFNLETVSSTKQSTPSANQLLLSWPPPSYLSFLNAWRWCNTLFIHLPSLQVHFILDEMLSNGFIVETNKTNILAPLHLLEKANQAAAS